MMTLDGLFKDFVVPSPKRRRRRTTARKTRSVYPRDNQRARAYKWEKAVMYEHAGMPVSETWGDYLIPKHLITEQQASDVMDTLAKTYAPNMSRCKVVYKVWKNKGGYHRPAHGKYNEQLGFNPLYLTVPLVIHEMAHAIIHHRHGLNIQGHGMEWMGLYMQMLHEQMGVSYALMEDWAKVMKLKYNEPQESLLK